MTEPSKRTPMKSTTVGRAPAGNRRAAPDASWLRFDEGYFRVPRDVTSFHARTRGAGWHRSRYPSN